MVALMKGRILDWDIANGHIREGFPSFSSRTAIRNSIHGNLNELRFGAALNLKKCAAETEKEGHIIDFCLAPKAGT